MGLALTEGRAPRPPATATFQEQAAPPPPARKPDGSAKQEIRPSPAPAPAKSFLAQAVETDDLCLASYTSGKQLGSPTQAELSGLLRTLGAPSSLQEMFAENGPIFGPVNPKKRFSSSFLNLMYALRLAGLYNISNKESAARDEDTALKILKELESADPSNGAYPYFQLALLHKKSANKEELFETAERVALASYFDAMLSSQLAELEGQRWQSATHAYVMEWLSGQVSRIQYHATHEAVNSAADGPDLTDLKDRIGRVMTQEGLRASRRSQLNGFDSGAYTYGTIFTTDEEPYHGDLSDEVTGSKWRYSPYVSRDKGDCKREEFDKYYEEMRGIR
jgi:hypothetical protein